MKLDLVSINPCPIKQSVKDYQSVFVYNAVVIEFTILTNGRIIGAILQTNTKLVRDYSPCHFKKSCMIINIYAVITHGNIHIFRQYLHTEIKYTRRCYSKYKKQLIITNLVFSKTVVIKETVYYIV